MKRHISVLILLTCGLACGPVLMMFGCAGGGADGGGGGGGGTAQRVISYNSDPDEDLAATADNGEGGEYAVYGQKDEDGDLTSVEQVDMALADGTTVSIEFDETGQPVYMTSSDGGEATFSYDEDTDTVIADVTTAEGDNSVDEAAGVGEAGTVAAKPRARWNKSQQTVCDNLDQALAVMDAFFGCDEAGDNAVCEDALAQAAAQLEELCVSEFTEVDDLETELGDEPRDIELGVEAFYTVRQASNDGTTVILTSTPFGGSRPYDVQWSFIGGDSTPTLENLPGGAAVADVFVAGSYTFHVEVTDSAGASAGADITFATDEVSFLDIVVSSAYPAPGESVTFTAAGADGPAASDADRFTYLWNFGDGQTGEGQEVEHAFDDSGEYVVLVVATSAEGSRSKGSVVIHVDEDQDCKDICFDSARNEYYDCLLAGGSEADCGPQAQATLQECALAECGEEFDCTKICHGAAREVYEACVASGVSDGDCEGEAFAALDACLSEQCREEVDCTDLCAQGADAVYNECLAAGVSEDECSALFEQVYVDCTEGGCEQTRDCQEKCDGVAQRSFEECIHNGGSEAECGARARTLAETCLLENCDEELDCSELCAREGRRVFDQCMAEGGSEERCAEKTNAFYMTCQSEHCDVGPGECELECGQMADAMIVACMAAGGTEEACVDDAEDEFLACLQNNCGLEGECGRGCVELGLDFYARCYNELLDAEACAAQAYNGVTACIANECGETSGCPDECHAEGSALYAECVATATDPGLCGQYSVEEYADCMLEGCEDAGGGEDECAEMCDATADQAYNDCLSSGGTEDDCFWTFDGAYEECVLAHCGDSGDDDDWAGDCLDGCAASAAAAEAECLSSGLSAEDCGALYHSLYEECAMYTCGQTSGGG